MISLPKVEDVNVAGTRVLVRADLDVPITENSSSLRGEWVVADDNRLKLILPTIELLIKRKAEVILCGHLGRPGKIEDGEWKLSDEEKKNFSLFPVGQRLKELLGESISYSFSSDGDVGLVGDGALVLLENLRFDPGENLDAIEADRQKLAAKLAGLADIYVNESFAESHPEVASTVRVPRLMREQGKQVAVGLRFAREIEMLSKVLENPKRPLVVVIGGAKLESKLPVISKMEKFADRVLVGGKLPSEIAAEKLSFSDKVVVASIAESGRDIDGVSTSKFEGEVNSGGTIVWGGPMGVFEEEDNAVGTRRVAAAIAGSGAYKVAGGGDTEEAIRRLGLTEKFDWISIGGGAMLEFLATGTLPGIEALVSPSVNTQIL